MIYSNSFFKSCSLLDSCHIEVSFVKLADIKDQTQKDKLIKQAGVWATKNWQHIFPSIPDWEEDVRKYQECFYFAMYTNFAKYGKQPVAMFAMHTLDEYKNYSRPMDVQ